jgi:chorismate mutase / prephenate dehydratase
MMTDKRREVEDLRGALGKLDQELLELLDRRAKLSKKVGQLRRSMPTDVISVPDRAMLAEIVARGSGDMPKDSLEVIFRQIFASCLALEDDLIVAYNGLEGGFAHAAARSRFGASSQYVACESSALAIDEVTRKRAVYALVPYETRDDGPAQGTIAALAASDAKIVASFVTALNLHIANRTGNLADVERVYAIAKDAGRCHRFLTTELGSAQVIDVKSPALAVQLAAEDPKAAAIATEGTLVERGLELARRNIRDAGDDQIRWAIIGSRPSSRAGNDFTAIALSVHDKPGALHEVLSQFAERGVNLTRIQSRPTAGEAWNYLFFIEVEGHATDRPIVLALEDVRKLCKFLKVLGSYQV